MDEINADSTSIRRDRKQIDPQIIVPGRLSHGPNADVIVFRLRFLVIDITCVATVPAEGTDEAPVYVHFRIDKSRCQPPGSVQRKDEEE